MLSSETFKYQHLNMLQKYNLQSVRTTSDWDDFPYDEITLKEFWNESTYRVEEGYFLSALSAFQHHVQIKSAYYLIWGQCHTILPLIQTTSSGKGSGYSVMLYQKEVLYNRSENDPEEGWHIFVHPATDPWTETTHEYTGEDENLLLAVGEELHVRIGVQEYHLVNKADDHCNASLDHSYEECQHMCKMRQLVNKIGCSGPWIPEVDVPLCNEYETMKNLMKYYINNLTCGSPCCNCIRPCHSLQFVPYIVKRQPMVTTEPNHRFSQLYLFYNSRMVQVAEEHLAYDWSLFLSDLGGSLGFLLGLSVLGIIGIVERLIDLLYGSLQLPAQVKTSGGRQLGLNSNKDSDEHMDCICCRAEEKSLSLHNMETMKCKSKLSPQPHDTKY
ncbi:Amiloride-sensitive cation channel 2-A, neuronal [Zootermopsis nevadensis]|uniref:Amiloride-sensitive cation channel 2-A, neuronal n=1 Tax=Zootermopsis nevadensis TaxID=136037 RepID=A0A067RJC5_ZOONE|nr:Amiloride-sensitive cation channel 2-A, neuronal [Zootermopsis nevadensis]